MRLFLFRLAGYLGMTVQQLEQNMTSRELSEWVAVDIYHQPITNSWLEAGTVAAAAVAPYAKKGKEISPHDFVPKQRLPQTQAEMAKELSKLKMISR
jgi:hypothetical protein